MTRLVDDEVMQRLWEVMIGSYGGQWEREFGHVGGGPYLAWSKALAGYTTDQVGRGVKALADEGSDYVPSMVKFCRLCRTALVPYHQAVEKALPAPRPRRSVVRIEQAKQLVMTGECYAAKAGNRYIEDWTDEHEARLSAVVDGFVIAGDEDPLDALKRLDEAIKSEFKDF